MYYIEFGTTLLITTLLVESIYRVTCFLDLRYPWNESLPQRIFLQFLLGVVMPTVTSYLLAAVYFGVQGYDITDYNYHLYALPFIAVLITLFNAYYYLRYVVAEKAYYKNLQESNHSAMSFSKNGHSKTVAESSQEVLVEAVANSQSKEGSHSKPAAAAQNEITYREVFMVITPLRTIPIRMDDICSFYRVNGVNFLRTYDQKASDAYVITQTLKEVEEQINPSQFFRINRQMIISFNSCVSFRNGKGKTLELIIEPKHADYENKMVDQPFVMVSEDRSQAFRVWVER
ncbi:LytTr DNA-binding domain-containing protein [Taibaiella chishuiensis]|uniref:LytTr DNA-binding domain-containing protein n=2 Tax=Taibaiella chishuiensis TaxID=1434707 RepID=A0A2P8D0R7_9BACT|nr:LytTr DNA-binding domain-containing protein [Taibaiella chishuiensis]